MLFRRRETLVTVNGKLKPTLRIKLVDVTAKHGSALGLAFQRNSLAPLTYTHVAHAIVGAMKPVSNSARFLFSCKRPQI
jgi:hypothetical protein